MDFTATTYSDPATLAWLVSALEHARAQGQNEVLDYLESIADDVVFETEMAARNRLRYPQGV